MKPYKFKSQYNPCLTDKKYTNMCTAANALITDNLHGLLLVSAKHFTLRLAL